MSYTEVIETVGPYRLSLELDEYADEPYDDGASPLLRLDRAGYGVRAEHVMASGRPLDADVYVEGAIQHWQTTPSDSDWRLFEKYLRAYHGVTQIETWYSGSYWYVTYDSAAWRAYTGARPGSASMDEYRAWCEGECYAWVLEKRVTWTTDDPAYADEDRWETADACGGYYGSEWAGTCAREALTWALTDAAGKAAQAAGPAILASWLG